MLSVRPSENSNDGEKKTVAHFEGGARIDFKSVNFKYPTRDVTVFKNLNFTVCMPAFIPNFLPIGGSNANSNKQIEKGQFAALVGPSGTFYA